MRVSLILLTACAVFSAATAFLKVGPISSTAEKKIEIRGIYGSPELFWKKGHKLSDLGVNAIFMHDKSINESIMRNAKADGIKVYAEFPTLNGKGYVESHPEAWPIDKNGNKVEPATWFIGVCPTEPGFRRHREEEVRKLLHKHDLAGIWLDYVHWHAQFEDQEPILPETCFCDNCLMTFQSASAIKLPEGTTAEKAGWILFNYDKAWRDWRCSVVTDWVRDFKKIVHDEKPGALLGVYHCPWVDDDFDGARRRILGLDYDSLKNVADVFSPMVYHGRMSKDPLWVKENTEWFSTRLGIGSNNSPKVWPIVQAYDDPEKISPADFEKVLRYGVAGKSTGVMMFTSNSVAESDDKIAIMKKVYNEWKKRQ